MSQNKTLVKSTRLQWNSLRNSEIFNYTTGYKVSIISKMSTVVQLSGERKQLLEMIWRLHTQGMENNEINNYLNSRKIKPRRTKVFSSRYIWSLLKKYSARKKNQKEIEIRIKNTGFYKQ